MINTSDTPKLQEFQIEGVKHIAPENAYEEIAENRAVLIDVREIHEVKTESIPLDNVLYHPMSVIMDRLPYIAKDQQIILGCTKGVRSSKVANLMNLQGYPNVANLDGGFQTWKAKGLPYENSLYFIPEVAADAIPRRRTKLMEPAVNMLVIIKMNSSK